MLLDQLKKTKRDVIAIVGVNAIPLENLLPGHRYVLLEREWDHKKQKHAGKKRWWNSPRCAEMSYCIFKGESYDQSRSFEVEEIDEFSDYNTLRTFLDKSYGKLVILVDETEWVNYLETNRRWTKWLEEGC